MPLLVTAGAFFVFGTISGTNLFSELMKDHTHPPFKLAVLRDRKGDLSKEWFVEFYAWSDAEKQLIRKRVKIPLAHQNVKSRTDYANKLIAKINRLLESGYHFSEKHVASTSEGVPTKQGLVKSLQSILGTISRTIASKTVVTYQSALNKFKEYAPEQDPEIDNFRTQDALLFRDHLLNIKKNSPRTANNTMQHLLALFSRLQERTGIEKNPFRIKSLREPATSKNIAFTDEDRAKVEEYLLEHEPGVYLFTRFLYYAFIRPGELLEIRFDHLHMRDGYITVHGLTSKNGKTETAQIIPALANEIQTRLEFQQPDHYLFSTGIKPGKYTLSKQVPFRRHEQVLENLGLLKKGYTLYSWKHTGAVNAYRAGVGIKELQSLLRHSSIQITDIYLKSLGLRTDPNLKNYSW